MSAALLMGGLQMLGGAVQGILGTRRANRAERALENLSTPHEQANAAVNNYYASANADPYNSAAYKVQQQNIARSGANALRAAQDRGGGVATVSNIVRGTNDATLNAAARAEQIQDAKLRTATGLKVQDDRRLFDINQMLPYQKKYQLLAQKAAGGNALANAGWRNLFGGAQTAAIGMGGGAGNGGNVNYLSYGQGE